MSTPLTVKTQMQSLLNLANETTGKSDVTLTDGVNSLVEGYGQGSGGVNVELYDITWETTNGVEVDIEYLGVDENNTLTKMNSSGANGSFSCIEGFYLVMTTSSSTNSWGETTYHNLNEITNASGYVESYRVDNTTRFFRINSSTHLTFECSAGGW